jgi:hypothetical protein
MTRNAARFLAAAVVLSALAAACGGGGGGTKTTAQTVSPSNTSKQHTPVVLTGTPDLDQVIGAALAANDIELAGLAGYEKVACKKDSTEKAGAPPACRESESDGTQVEVLASSACDLGWVRPEQVPDAFRSNLSPEKPELVSVYKPHVNPADFGGGFGADAVAVFRTNKHVDGQAGGVALHIKVGRVVWIEADCRNLTELTAPQRVDSIIFDPAVGAVPATATATPEQPTATPTPGG